MYKRQEQLSLIRKQINIPLIASGGAGKKEDFLDVFENNCVDGALAASIFHKKIITIGEVKKFLIDNGVNIRNGN